MNYLGKNMELKDFLIGIVVIVGIIVIVSSFIGVSEAAVNKDTSGTSSISKNLKIKDLTISNNTKGGIKGAVDKSESGTTIYLKKGVYRFNNTDIGINKKLTIIGNGSAKYVIIDARNKGRVFDISKYGKLTLINVTIKNGRALEEYSGGGAIYNEGSLKVENSVFKRNRGDYGGAIYNEGSLKVKSSVFERNSGSTGGAICSDAKYPTYIWNSKFLNNKDVWSRAISNNFWNYGSKIVVKKSYFKNNGIENWNDGSQISNNKFDINYRDYSSFYDAIYNYANNGIIANNTIISRGLNLYSGIGLWGNNNKVYNNKLYGSFEYGIDILGFKNIVTNNQLYGKNKGMGIYIDYYYDDIDEKLYISKYNKVSKNKVSKFKYGIYVYKGFKTNTISYNKLIKNSLGLASSYKFKNKTNIFKGNKKNIMKIKK